jgi:hypothetical protein
MAPQKLNVDTDESIPATLFSCGRGPMPVDTEMKVRCGWGCCCASGAIVGWLKGAAAPAERWMLLLLHMRSCVRSCSGMGSGSCRVAPLGGWGCGHRCRANGGTLGDPFQPAPARHCHTRL